MTGIDDSSVYVVRYTTTDGTDVKKTASVESLDCREVFATKKIKE
jgi:hypothetical protein